MSNASHESMGRVRGGACCTDERKMVKCTMTALEKIKEMFGSAHYSLINTPTDQTAPDGCMLDSRCRNPGCPFRETGIAPNALRKYCDFKQEDRTKKKETEHTGVHLLPGEVGLRENRATFHMGSNLKKPPDIDAPAGAVYYNMPTLAGDSTRKHVMQVMSKLPKSTKPLFGPVTGLPINDDEDVFVMLLGKRNDEPDEKAKIQIEVRMPRLKTNVSPTKEEETQYLDADIGIMPPKPQKGAKKAANNKGKGDKKDKKGGKNKGGKKGKK